MKYIIMLFVFCFSGTLVIRGQNQVFEKFYSNYQTHCHFLVKDTLWLGTTAGLMKMLTTDNKILHIYSQDNSPIDAAVNAIWIDKNNRIYLVIGYQKVAMLEDNQWQTWNILDINGGPVSGNYGLTDIMSSDDGVLYCQDKHQGKMYAHKASNWVTLFDLNSMNSHFIKFLYHPNGTVWWFNETDFQMYLNSTDTLPRRIIDDDVVDVAFSPDSSLYGIKDDGAIIRINTNGSTLIKAKIPNVNLTYPMIHVGKNEEIYINDEKTLYIYKNGAFTRYVNDKLDNFYQVNISDSESGKTWIRYPSEDLVCKFDSGTFTLLKEGIFSWKSVTANSDRSILWFNYYYFVCSYNVKTGEIKHYELPIGTISLSLAASKDPNQMWLSSDKGLMQFNGVEWITKYIPGSPRGIYSLTFYSDTQLIGAISENNQNVIKLYNINTGIWTDMHKAAPIINGLLYLDKTRRLWSNLLDSLSYFDNGKWNILTSSNSNMPKEKWARIDFDSNNKLIAASNSKLYSYDFVNWELLDSNLCQYTNDLLIDSRDWIWLLSSCSKLNYFDGKKWTRLDTSNSTIPYIYDYTLEEDCNGDIWMSSIPAARYKVNLTNSIETNSSYSTLKVFPNPAGKLVTISCPDKKGTISIYNLTGQNILNYNITEFDISVSIDSLLPGIYVVIWRNGSNRVTSKLLIIDE